MDTIIWIVLMVVFLIVEGACPIHLVSLWFAAGAMVAAIVSILNGAVWLQILLFLVVSGGLLACLWPFVRKFLNPRITATNVDSVIGTEGYVTEAIDNLSSAGQVKLGGMYWSARSTENRLIPAGATVRVDRIEGVKAYVSEVKVEATI